MSRPRLAPNRLDADASNVPGSTEPIGRGSPDPDAAALPLALALATGVGRLQAGVVISEFMAVNASGLTDQDGDRSDWIEFHNESPDPVDLTGWHLTDNPRDLGMWTFPATRISGEG